MRLLAFSDLHNDLDRARDLVERSADVDVVAGVGDFASQHKGLAETIRALAAIATPTVLVPGNNETDIALREAAAGWPAAVVLHGDATDIAGATFFGLGAGVPTTPWDWSFDLTEEEAEERLAACPDGAVLLTHSPPKGHVDNGLGSRAVLDAIRSHHPKLVLCGHIHDCWGQESQANGARVVNLGPRGAVLEVDDAA